jgi:hypothetical protein
MKTGEVIEGDLSSVDAARVTAWISMRQKELEEDAKLIVAGKKVKPIEPIR